MYPRSKGFTLVELAVALTIVGLLLGGLMSMLSGAAARSRESETNRRLEVARGLLLAFATQQGRLPCPARDVATASPTVPAGFEVVDASGQCLGDGLEDYYGGTLTAGVNGGFLPARTLGMVDVDAAGFAIDSWGNRLRYAVAKTVYTETSPLAVCRPGSAAPLTPAFTSAGNLKNNGLSCVPSDLVVCASAVNAAGACDTTQITGPYYVSSDTTQSTPRGQVIVAIVFSTGSNGARGAAGTNEQRNLDGNAIFVSRTPDSSGAAGGEFDDSVVWISASELYKRLVDAAKLP